jgi:hypothetical protein
MKNKIKSLPRKSRAVIALCEIPLSRLERKIALVKHPPNMLWSISFIGEFLPNFDLKNMISTYTKDFS